MKTTVAAFFLILILSACKTQLEIFTTNKQTNLGVVSSKFRGTIFKENYPFSQLYVSDVDSTKRFTPTKQDIEEAEKILRSQINKANESRPNQYRNRPLIHRNLNNYFRQYVGFVNSKGEKIIHVNFYWDKLSVIEKLKGYSDRRLKFEDEYAIVFDGGSRYWQININLTIRSLSDLQVNGIA